MAEEVNKGEVFELSGYITSMSSRLQSLQRTANLILNHLDMSATTIDDKKKELIKELDEIKDDVADIKEDIRFLQKAILKMINQFKNSVKADDYERFKKRIDIWAPETFVTRNEVNKVLDEL
jgi:seryl-tRNA synthetase